MSGTDTKADVADSKVLLAHHLKKLKLPTILAEYEKQARQCAEQGFDYPRYLLRLVELELIERQRKTVERRIRAAKFPATKSLDSFDFRALPDLNKVLVLELARAEFIMRRENIIALGPSGTGKTHLATGLGLAACQKAMSVGFVTAAGLPSTIVDEIGSYIPEIALDQFLDRAAHLSGDDLFGLSVAQHLSVREYGAWGDYVLEAPDLISALRRATGIMHLHANNDELAVRGGRQTMRMEYRFGERGGNGYRQIVLAAIGPMLSIPRHFLGGTWKPRSIEFEIFDQPTAQRIERILNCSVRSGRSCVAIELPNRDLGTPKPSTCTTRTTWHDVERECRGGPP